MSNIKDIITENTLVPIGLALAIISGATFWLTTIYLQNVSHGEIIQSMTSKQEKYNEDLHKIMVDIAEIKIKLKIIDSSLKNMGDKNED